MKTKQIVDAYVNAINTDQWDFPKDMMPPTTNETYRLVCEGKTMYHFCREAVAHYGTITGSIMAFGGIGHVSASTRKAIRQAVIYSQSKTSNNSAI
jgi:hypothetical protein